MLHYCSGPICELSATHDRRHMAKLCQSRKGGLMLDQYSRRVLSIKELLNPTLEVIHALGGHASNAQMTEGVIRLLGLPASVADTPHGDGRRTELEYRLGWTRTYLKTYGLVINSGRGKWSLTPLGCNTHQVDHDEVMEAVLQRSREARQPTSREDGQIDAMRLERPPLMTRESTVSDLKEEVRKLEAEKRRIEEQHRALVISLRYFENLERAGPSPSMPLQHTTTDDLGVSLDIDQDDSGEDGEEDAVAW